MRIRLPRTNNMIRTKRPHIIIINIPHHILDDLVDLLVRLARGLEHLDGPALDGARVEAQRRVRARQLLPRVRRPLAPDPADGDLPDVDEAGGQEDRLPPPADAAVAAMVGHADLDEAEPFLDDGAYARGLAFVVRSTFDPGAERHVPS
jgi:hypothetical protein